jgi:hypothetical protein
MGVQRDDAAAGQHEDRVVEALVVAGQGGHVLVDDGVGAQEAPVPLPAGGQIGDGERDVVDGGRKGHG